MVLFREQKNGVLPFFFIIYRTKKKAIKRTSVLHVFFSDLSFFFYHVLLFFLFFLFIFSCLDAEKSGERK